LALAECRKIHFARAFVFVKIFLDIRLICLRLSLLYKQGGYQAFKINDPKPRNIHKASVSNNNVKTCWVLKCDIRKFFDNIDHQILIKILENYIPDKNIIRLLKEIINSFSAKQDSAGLPLGNLTSQLFVNIYMNEFGQFMKHKLKMKYYVRYADDFVVLSDSRPELLSTAQPIREFLRENLKLELHPKKLSISTIASGIDFLGWVSFSDHRILRTKTKQRMFKKLNSKNKKSYFGLISRGNTRKLAEKLANL